MTKLSLNRAAKEAHTAKSTLLDALKTGRMSGEKNEKGHWQIEAAELFRVFPPKQENGSPEPLPTPQENSHNTSALEVEVKMLREALEDARKDRDQWREQVQKMTAVIEDQTKKGGFFARLFGS